MEVTCFSKNSHTIINERHELFRLKLKCYSLWCKNKKFIYNIRRYNIRDYVRLMFLLGEPL